MKLPSFRRILKTDYKEEFQSLVETLSSSIKNGIEVIYQAFNKAINLKDNIACTVKEIEIEVDGSGFPKNKTSFTLDTAGRIIGICVLNAFHTKSSSILPSSGIFISFSQESKTIIISNIKGLPSNQVFRITLVAFDG